MVLRYTPLMARSLPTDAEVREILARRRTRPVPRPAPRAGRALEGLVKGLDERFGRGASALEPRWREIVGDRLARVTRPQKLSRGRIGADGVRGGGVLELRVAGPAALLVQHQAADIIERVNLFLGAGSVERLRIAQGPVSPLPGGKTALARPRRTPLSAEAEAKLKAEVAEAPDTVRAALERLGRAVLSDPTRNER